MQHVRTIGTKRARTIERAPYLEERLGLGQFLLLEEARIRPAEKRWPNRWPKGEMSLTDGGKGGLEPAGGARRDPASLSGFRTR
jgi:hypothetical protein